jgi:hypothetical protein
MITIPIGNTVLFLSENEEGNLREELETRCHAADLQGEGFIEIPNLLTVSIDEVRTLIGDQEDVVNWGRDGF